ncbi:hypothetical protein QBC41DRAFT_222943 [Cercophora samala]|uniref:Uncharacterized protein n=1 Tax=Cercophora samala TaxID=330535 RepID=A0AA39ZFB2_9PEZI|nr:hypothetical protein QBC41DRAFT_222943 [Cercophora samala]
MATDDLQILPPDSARVHLSSRGFVKLKRVAQSTTESVSDAPWLTTTSSPSDEEVYLARLTAGNLEELATALRCQLDGETQLYEVAIRAVPGRSSSPVVGPMPSQTPEHSVNAGEHYDSDDSVDSDELLLTSQQRELRKMKRAQRAASSSQRHEHSGTSHSTFCPPRQVLEPNARPTLFFHWSHAEDQKARKHARAARIAALVRQTQRRRKLNRSQR